MHYPVHHPSSPVRWVLLPSMYLSSREAGLGFPPSLQDPPVYEPCPAGSGMPASGRGRQRGAGGAGECFLKGGSSSTGCRPAVIVELYQPLVLPFLLREASCCNTAPRQSLPPPAESLPLCLLPSKPALPRFHGSRLLLPVLTMGGAGLLS